MKLKEKPEDFYVEEILDLKVNKKGDYCYFLLEKKNWTTTKAISTLAKIMKVSDRRFSFAGQKDRVGITKQYVSVQGLHEEDFFRLKVKDMNLTFLGYGDNPIELGSAKGNFFRLVVKELEKPLDKVDCFVNYYDDQRFGGYRPNLHWVGKAYIMGYYEEAVRMMLCYPFNTENKDYRTARKLFEKNWGNWKECLRNCPKMMEIESKILRSLVNDNNFKKALKSLPRQLFSMIPHAYQSYLWNESLSRYLRKKYKGKEVEYCCGKFFFVSKYVDLDWPIIDKATKVSGEIKEVIDKLLKEEGLSYSDFDKEKGLTRKAMIKLQDVKFGRFNRGVQEVSFFLPPGAYATMVMKTLN